MMRRYYDRAGAIYVNLGLARRDVRPGLWYECGYAQTRCGVVGVYREAGYTRLTVISDGRQYDRTIRRDVTERGLVTMAGRFARDVVAGKLEPATRQRRAARRAR